jgi:hypothetical protein
MPMVAKTAAANQPQIHVLVLYDHASVFTNTVREYLESFALYSRYRVSYAAATTSNRTEPIVDLSPFDAVLIHYSVRLCYDWHILPDYAKALERFHGPKLLFIQDEYDHTNMARQWITKLGIDVVFTCVPPRYVQEVYPPSKLPNVCFVPVLTGYAPLADAEFSLRKPLAARKYVLGYRGRQLPFRYGDLGRDKVRIAIQMREALQGKGIPFDIEYDDRKRIYGGKWIEFLRDCRATLGTESGSNVFDFDGSIDQAINHALKQNPNLTYQEVHSQFLAEFDGKIRMNQISPRVFEAIHFGTALVLFEGEYSGVIKPDLHYIPLKKDFDNVDQVLSKLQDDAYLEELTTRAYADIIQSGQYTYPTFVAMVDREIEQRVSQIKGKRPLEGIIAWEETAENVWRPATRNPQISVMSMCISRPVQQWTEGDSSTAPELTAMAGPVTFRHAVEYIILGLRCGVFAIDHSLKRFPIPHYLFRMAARIAYPICRALVHLILKAM